VTIRPEPDLAICPATAVRRAGGMPLPAADHDDAPDPMAPSVASADLLGKARELMILHGQDTYRLRLTRHGKLILTK
jgi:hemin uptake protein HemP